MNYGKLKYTFNGTNGGHFAYVTALANLQNGLLASGSADHMIKLWDLSVGKLNFTFDASHLGHSAGITCLAMLENGYLSSGSGISISIQSKSFKV